MAAAKTGKTMMVGKRVVPVPQISFESRMRTALLGGQREQAQQAQLTREEAAREAVRLDNEQAAIIERIASEAAFRAGLRGKQVITFVQTVEGERRNAVLVGKRFNGNDANFVISNRLADLGFGLRNLSGASPLDRAPMPQAPGPEDTRPTYEKLAEQQRLHGQWAKQQDDARKDDQEAKAALYRKHNVQDPAVGQMAGNDFLIRR